LGKVLLKRQTITNGVNSPDSTSEVLDYAIQPDRFFELKKGGADYNYNVSFIIVNPNWHNLYSSKYFFLMYNQKTNKIKRINRKLLSERNYESSADNIFEVCIGIAIIGFILWIYFYFSGYS
jgi:hypothetical protein